MLSAQVQPLVGELRFHKPRGTAKTDADEHGAEEPMARAAAWEESKPHPPPANQDLRAGRNPDSKHVQDSPRVPRARSGKTTSSPPPADTSQLAPLTEDQQGGRSREQRLHSAHGLT